MNTFHTLAFALFASTLAHGQVALPWHHADAGHRTVYRINSLLPMRDAAVTLPHRRLAGPLTLLEADNPQSVFHVWPGTNGLTFILSGLLAPDKPRTVIAYTGGSSASPTLEEEPRQRCDYALIEGGPAWDFENGTTCGIISWGNRAHDYGPVSVTDGWLQVPVKGSDPYFIFGNMFSASPHPKDLHIPSALYQTLEVRVRQSCPHAEWEFFVTDLDGQHKSLAFEVHGTEAQTFRFDLKACFPEFWDGRIIRAFRLDTTNDKRDMLAEVDYVRILPSPPAVLAGPTLSREAVAIRDTVRTFKALFPDTVTAGTRGSVVVRTYTDTDKTASAARAIWALTSREHATAFIEGMPDGKATALTLPVLTSAGEQAVSLGLADDLGVPLQPVTHTLRVTPAPLASLRLTPAKTYVGLESPATRITLQGLDAFGNRVPVDIRKPLWSLPPGVSVAGTRIQGNPADAVVTFPATNPSSYAVSLADGKGHHGETSVTTVAYRKESIRINANGYLITPAGTLFFPSGGLYANWPHRLNADGTVSRALDLFPCGPSPYQEGFPWSASTEAAVSAYLTHCSERGITCLRLMLRNMDLVGGVDPVQLKATLHLFDLARPYGIRFNVALFEDYDKPPYVSKQILEKLILPHYSPAQLSDLPPHRARFLVNKDTLPSAALRYTDPDAIACQRDYLRALIPVLAAREEVLCYEFENEMVYPPMSWCADTAAFIRSIDPHTLILGNPGPHTWPEPLRWRQSGCDLYSYHPYNDGQGPADHGAIIFLRSKWSAQSGLPMYTGEGGLNQNRWQNEVKKIAWPTAARGTRDQIWMSVCCGANGCLYWTLMNDLEAREFSKVQPALTELGIDLAALKRQRPAVALLHPHKQRDPLDAAMAMRLLDLGVDFDTVTTNEATAYAVRIDASKQSPESLSLPATVATPSQGWQVATLLSENRAQALIYLRNVAGGVKDNGAPPRPCLLREVQPADAAITLRAPWRLVTVYDLDMRQARTVTASADGRIALGQTSHDFLIGLRN